MPNSAESRPLAPRDHLSLPPWLTPLPLLRDGHKNIARCRQQTSLVDATTFQSTKLPLTTWLLALHLLTQSKNNISVPELKGHEYV